MAQPPRLRSAPLLDLACIVTFIVIGRRSHGIDDDVRWFLTVLWPLAVGWYGVALLTGLYSRREGVWRALAITALGGIGVAQVLRASFTDHPWVSFFVVIAWVFVGTTTFGWRLLAARLSRRSRASAA